MKRSNTLVLLALVLGVSTLHAQHREVRNVDDFTKISFGLPGKLYLKQGSPQKVELEGDRGILEKVETKVSSGQLKIGRENQWGNRGGNEKIIAYVTVPNIEAVSVSGSGDVIGQDKIRTDDLDLKVSGSGALSIEIDARGEVDADVSGSGNLEVRGKAESIESAVSGSGRVKLSVTLEDEAEFVVSGSGKIEARGSAKKLQARVTGSGKVLAAALETDRCDVEITGSGDVEINVKHEIEANITGSGNVLYRGDPKKINSRATGSGKVKKM